MSMVAMWGVLLLVVVTGVVAVDNEAESDDPFELPDTDKIVEQLEEAMKRQLKRSERLITAEMATLDTKLDEVKRQQQETQQLVTNLNTILESTKNEMLEAVSEVKAQASATLTQLAGVASHEDLVALKAKILTVIAGLAKEESLATILEEVMSDQLQQVTLKMDEVKQGCGSCGQADSMVQLIDIANSTNHSLDSLSHKLDETASTHASSCSQGCESVKAAVESMIGERLSTRNRLVTDSISRLQSSVDNIQDDLEEIAEYTRRPPSTTTTPRPSNEVLPETREQSPCEDSNFILGGDYFNVCAAAVRFKRCHFHILAYHCCSTCTASGQIPADGPWRYMNLPRFVSRITALQLMRTP